MYNDGVVNNNTKEKTMPEFENFEDDFLTQEQIEDIYDPDWDEDYEDDGQPDEYTEWQDYMGGDDNWDEIVDSCGY